MATITAGPGVTYDLPTASSVGAIPETEKGQPNGVATLGPDGRIPSSELALDALEYKGTWNAATNTPTLANGTGTTGDTYAVSVGGSQNLGGGSVTYTAGDLVIYNGTTWDQITTGNPVTPANPSGLVGTTAVNGSAATFMRSDAAPAINQAITPTWTGAHAFTSNVTVQGLLSSTNNTTPAGPTNSGVALSAAPDVADALFFDSTQSANNRTYEVLAFQGGLNFRFKNDAGDAATTWLKASGGQAAGITGITSNSGAGSWAHTGLFSVAASTVTAPPTSTGVHAFATSATNIPVLALSDGQHSANSKIAFLQYDSQYNLNIGFANDGFSNFTYALQLQGGQGFGMTGIQSNSGTGQWLHSGEFQVNGTVIANTYNGNGINLAGAVAGQSPTLSTMGVNPDVGLIISPKGSGGVNITAPTTGLNFVSTANRGISASVPSAGNFTFTAKTASDANDRWMVDGNGAHLWAANNGAPDTNLTRATAGGLSTNLSFTASGGLRVGEGSNAKQGVATLVGGIVTVNNTSVTANSRIFLTAQDNNTGGALRVSSRVAGTSFTIQSSSASDTGVVAYEIFEPGS